MDGADRWIGSGNESRNRDDADDIIPAKNGFGSGWEVTSRDGQVRERGRKVTVGKFVRQNTAICHWRSPGWLNRHHHNCNIGGLSKS
jgi:hypothetical protein